MKATGLFELSVFGSLGLGQRGCFETLRELAGRQAMLVAPNSVCDISFVGP